MTAFQIGSKPCTCSRAFHDTRLVAVTGGPGAGHALRVESADEAKAIDERILAVWEEQPRRVVVESDADFARKASRALEVVRRELPTCCHHHELLAGGAA